MDGITARHGHLDILVNAIGGYAGGKSVWETDPKTYQLMLTLNLHAGFNLARTVVPAMLRQKSGAIVNIASKAALDHAAGAGAYAASKAAALALFDCLAQDVKGSGIRVNSVLPSIIDTEPNRKAMPDADFSKWPKPEEIAQVILFLCSHGRQTHPWRSHPGIRRELKIAVLSRNMHTSSKELLTHLRESSGS